MHLLHQCAELQRHEDRRLLLQAARQLEEAALRFFFFCRLDGYLLVGLVPINVTLVLFKFSLDACV
jgi:hypothetical protein